MQPRTGGPFFRLLASFSPVPADAKRSPALETSFANLKQHTDDAIESRIASTLWQWKFADTNERDSLIADSKLATLIEFWFPFSEIEYTKQRGAWCDGIPLLKISPIDRTTFRIAGVGYFPHQLAPFELDFGFHKRRDVTPRAIILRLGDLLPERDQSGGQNKQPQIIFDSRPDHDSCWAVAVELTNTNPDDAG